MAKTKAEKLVDLLNTVGEEVELEINEFGLTDEEIELVETTIVNMKQRLFEELNK